MMDALLWPGVLLLVAIVLIVLEVFIPSGGMLSVLAAVAAVASIVVAYTESLVAGTVMLLVSFFVVPIVAAAAVRWWPHTPMGKLILAKRPASEDEVLPDTEEYHRNRLIGKRGVTKTAMLPSGDVLIEGRVYDSISSGMPIDAGRIVKVVAVDTQRLVVRPAGEGEAADGAGSGTENVLSTPIDSLGIEPFDNPLA
ncbi:MAG: hypothetical protein FJ276_20270 [Planctomycetes bacterium]|nr:hypothetical protein [Planctomycetota bacterium]